MPLELQRQRARRSGLDGADRAVDQPGPGDEIFPLELAHWLRDTIPGFRELIEIDGGKLFWPFERPGGLVPHVRRLWAEAGAPAGAA